MPPTAVDRAHRDHPPALAEDWAHESATRARDCPPLFQYPAMMVSPMQGALLDAVTSWRGKPPRVLDPFVGSGTTMLEAQRRGLPFTGVDINPLAILLCLVESGDAGPAQIRRAASSVVRRARREQDSTITPAAAWATKWYRPDVARRMAALQNSIRRVADIQVRRALWIALAELARTAGNHRPDAPKLQTRRVEELTRQIDVLGRFHALAAGTAGVLGERSASTRRDRTPQPRLWLGDTRNMPALPHKAELLLSSPPYGDNHTTMPYGQVAFLPLRWVDLADIDPHYDRRLLATSKTLDTASLGGSLNLDEAATARTSTASPTLRKVLAMLEDAPSGAGKRTAGFFNDLDDALAAAVAQLTRDAHAVLTLGGKTTYGVPVPTPKIVEELMAARGFRTLQVLTRRLRRNRRLPVRNERAGLICQETVLAMQREG
jgi:hypothetical protein